MGRRKILIAVFLSSFSSLAYQIVLTRLFSISLSYHFASMIISIAMLGIGASGTVLSLCPRLRDPSRIGFESFLLSLSFPTSYLAARAIPFDPVKLLWAITPLLYVLVYYLVLSIPFFLTGLIIAKAFASLSEESSLFYGGDLLGAGIGSTGTLCLMTLIGPDQAVFVICSVAAISAVVTGGKRLKLVSLGFMLIALTVVAIHPSWVSPQMSHYKELRVALGYPGAEHLKTYDSPFSRIDLFKSPAVRFAPGLSLRHLDPLPEQIGFTIDGGQINAVTSPIHPASLSFLKYLPASLPYEIRRPKDVLVLDPRGGLQVLLAKHYGVADVLKVEGNPLLARILQNDLREFSGDLYAGNTWTGLGRSFLRSGSLRFDLIDLSLMEAIPSGSFGISENYRFTVEAFKDYLEHLKPGGFLSVSVFLLPPPRIELRLIGTIAAAMKDLGTEKVWDRVVAIRTWGTVTIVVKRSPLLPDEVEAVRQFSKERRFDLVYYPGIREEETNRYVRMVSDDYFHAFKMLLDPETKKAFVDGYPFDIKPVRDENPFFHYYLKLENIRKIYETMGQKWEYFIGEGYLLPAIFIQAVFLSLILILLPGITHGRIDVEKAERFDRNGPCKTWLVGEIKGHGRRRNHLTGKPRPAAKELHPTLIRDLKGLSYFAFLGLGFMFVEISLVQKMILPLETPSYAVGTVLASVLISSGVGSLLARRVPALRTPSVAIGVFLATGVYSFLLPVFTDFTFSLSLPVKIPFVFLILLPLGLLMGIPFPTAIEALGKRHGFLIPWAWAINGCFSVLAPLLGVMLAMRWGFQTVLWLGAAAYLLAYLTSFSLLLRPSEQRRRTPSVAD